MTTNPELIDAIVASQLNPQDETLAVNVLRLQLLNDPSLTNTEKRIIKENPTTHPYELLATLDGFETS